MISSKEFGERIVVARRRAGLTQAEVAKRLGVSRPTLIAVEKGTRRASDEEIVRLAEVLGTSVHGLVRVQHVTGGAAPRFRLSPNTQISTAVTNAVEVLEEFGRDYALLERLCGVSSAPALLETVRSFQQQSGELSAEAASAGRQAAEFVRSALRIGDGPFPQLDERLEAAAGVRIFYMDLPPGVAGLFLWGDEIKGCIGINAKHRRERQRWSLAHEFGHYLRDREAGDVLTDDEPTRGDPSEIFADTFARHCLMPEAGVRARFDECKRSVGGFTVGDLVSLAHEFQVSFQAMCLRLEEIGCVPGHTYNKLVIRKFSPEVAKKELGLTERPGRSRLPRRYMQLALIAFDRGKVSEGELAQILRVDRISAREIVLEWLGGGGGGGGAVPNLATDILRDSFRGDT